MTLFKKYYKDANNDIKADEAFINSVIENAHKPRAKRTPYYKYALTAAAAFMIISATAIALPILTDNNDDGVITVVTETIQPSAPVATPKTDTAIKPAEVKQQETPIMTSAPRSVSEPTVIPTEKPEEKRATKKVDELKQEAVAVSGAADMLEDTISDDATMKYSSANASLAMGVTTDSGAEVAADKVQPMPVVLPPTGYYASETGSGMYVFVSESGAEITVTYNYTDAPDTSPVYGEESVSFISHSTEFNITFHGAEKSAVDEIVKSLI